MSQTEPLVGEGGGWKGGGGALQGEPTHPWPVPAQLTCLPGSCTLPAPQLNSSFSCATLIGRCSPHATALTDWHVPAQMTGLT